MANEEDIVHSVTGNFGRWQLRTIILVFLCKIPTSWFMACVIYTAPVPQKTDYYCKPTAIDNGLGENTNQSHLEAWIQKTYPSQEDEQKTDREFQFDQCYIHKPVASGELANYTNPFDKPLRDQNSATIVPCDHFEHIAEYKSLVTEFDLVCSRQLLVSVTQSFHALGALIGGFMAVKLLKR